MRRKNEKLPLCLWLFGATLDPQNGPGSGGVFAAYYLVASLIAIRKLGTAAVFALVNTGQMIGALVLDSTGAFGAPHLSLTSLRLLGTVLLLAGVILIQKR
jgi:transporter family-2 protein